MTECNDAEANACSIQLGNRRIGADHRCYLVAEMSANHHQELSLARELIHAMKESGADAVKLQTYTPDTMTLDLDRADFQIGEGTVWAGKRLFELYGQAMTPWEWHAELFELANRLGLDAFSSPFDVSAVDFLEPLNPVAYKIASFELIDLPLVEYVASKGRPVIMSTGMASFEEIADAVAVVKSAGTPLVLLKCTSAYPAPIESMNLRMMQELADVFQVPVGLSDHSLHPEVAVAAVALGAVIIEKHFTLSRERPGPDSSFSLEPAEFLSMVESIRLAEQAIGKKKGTCSPNEAEQACLAFRRSLYAVRDIAAEERFTTENIRSLRPAGGLSPKHLAAVLRCTAACDISGGTPINWHHCHRK